MFSENGENNIENSFHCESNLHRDTNPVFRDDDSGNTNDCQGGSVCQCAWRKYLIIKVQEIGKNDNSFFIPKDEWFIFD